VREVGAQVRAIVVPEMNLGQMAHEVEWAVRGACAVGRVNRVDGEPISPLEIVEAVEQAVRT
jgi:2-oxoglutarate ferredoxin oxidoreductase subunit alpha